MSKINLTFDDSYKKANKHRKNGLSEFAEDLKTRIKKLIAALLQDKSWQ